MNPMMIINLIWGVALLVYGIYMIMYLGNAKKCDKYMKKKDKTFRKAALVITWVQVVIMGLSMLWLFAILVSGHSVHLVDSNDYMVM